MKMCTQIFFVLIYYAVHLASSADRAQILKFDRIPSGAPLAGLACAIEKCGTGLIRGVKFDTATRVCEPLSSSWFSNPIIENKSVYYKLRMMENEFIQTKDLQTILPRNFVLGSTLKFYVRTGYETTVGRTTVDIGKPWNVSYCFHSNMRHSVPVYVFTANPGYKAEKLFIYVHPLKKTYTTYTIEFNVMPSGFQVLVGDTDIVTYGHKTDFFNCDSLKFSSDYHFLQRFQILYPN